MMDPARINRTLPGPPESLIPPTPYPVGSSLWWIDKLSRKLLERRNRFATLEAYYRGTQDTQRLASAAYREAGLAALFPRGLKANHARLIVNASASRLVVLGFRLAGELRADTEAARIWRMNEMESQSDIALTESLVKGECPVLVEPNPRDPTTPIITPQEPEDAIVWHAGGDRRIRLAAMKTWWDETVRRRFYTLYLPDRIERWQDRQPSQMDVWLGRLLATTTPAYELRGSTAQAVSRNPIGEVPMVVIPNEPLLAGRPEAEHEGVLDLMDLYNKTLMDMASSSHELAFPQRFGTGFDETEEEQDQAVDAAGLPIVDPAVVARAAQTGQNRMLLGPAGSAFGQFAAAQLSNYVAALDSIRADESTISFTPYNYLLGLPTSVAPSGEAITATEMPFVDKIRGHARDKGSAWRTIMRLAFLLADDKRRADAMAGGVCLWSDPERRTESQHVDALGKMAAADGIGLPREAVWELLPAAPQEIERWKAMLQEEADAAPPTPPAASDQTPVQEPATPPVGGQSASTAPPAG